ncbi:DUF3713 domain-containing protein [[Mycoplasma] cavipharyngis]|uniref:DUF3713 domain-containing protein n=1 Tax=[Mycoplasma] cavipharyngis TaxID=92757 RepID=UPI0037038D72
MANKLKFNWVKDFAQDTTVDQGSSLFATQTTIKNFVEKGEESFDNSLKSYQNGNSSNWDQLFQRVINPFGGTKDGWIINHVGPAVNKSLVEAIFNQLFLNYKKTENNTTIITKTASASEINNPSNFNNFVFEPSQEDLEIGNQKYQKMFANFQAFVFNYWFEHERPFLGWNVEWKYGTSSINSLTNIYSTNQLAKQDVNLPTDPNYNFPAFDIGDSNTTQGILPSFNRWQTGVKSGSLFNNQTGGLSLTSVFNDNKPDSTALTSWRIYTNEEIANINDGYLSSAIVHQYNKLFDTSSTDKSGNSNQLINKIDLTGNNNWTSNKYDKDPLNLFLKKDSNQVVTTASTPTTNSEPGIKIDQQIFNQLNDKKDTSFIYPLRDIETESKNSNQTFSNNKHSYWTVARSQTGFNALTIDGAPLIAKETTLVNKLEKVKQNLLWRQAAFSLNPRKDVNAVFDPNLLEVLKKYAEDNFNQILVAYTLSQTTNPNTKLSQNTNNDYFFSQQQNYLTNTTKYQTLIALVQELEQLNQGINSQKILIDFRNKLAQTVSSLATRPFRDSSSSNVVNNQQQSNDLKPPYANGLATPLAFKRNLNTNQDDPVYQPSDKNNQLTKNKQTNQTYQNDGDYPEITKFYKSEKINTNAKYFGINFLYQNSKTIATKVENWLKTLKNSNDGLFFNQDLIHLDSLEFNYLLQSLLDEQDSNLKTYIQNLYLANEIKYDYQTDRIDYDFENKTSLATDFSSEKDNLKTEVENAIAETVYSEAYLGSVNNINNGRDFIGGYKIEEVTTPKSQPMMPMAQVTNDPNQNNIKSYNDKVKSYWKQILYSFSNQGWELGSNYTSKYIRTLYTIQWLLEDNYANLLNYLQSQIAANSYGAIVWAQEKSLNEDAKSGEAKTSGTNSVNSELADFATNFQFNPNPNNVLSNPYFSYNLNAPTTRASNSSLFNYVTAKAPTQITNSNTANTTRLNGFYGLVLDNKPLPNTLPQVVQDALFKNFAKANPDGNLSAFDINNSSNKEVISRGKLFGSAINSKTSNVSSTLNFIFESVKNIRTFNAFNQLGQNLSNLFPKIANYINDVINTNQVSQLEPKKDSNGQVINNQFQDSKTLPPLKINLSQKIKALTNVLNGIEYKLDRTNNDRLIASFKSIYDQIQPKKANFNLINSSDLERFVGTLQNPDNQDSIYTNLKYFLPSSKNSRIGYVAYAFQINSNDVSDVTNFRNFIKLLGFDAFIKTVVNLARSSEVQSLAFDSFILRPSFNRLVTKDERIVNLLGLSWATLEKDKK